MSNPGHSSESLSEDIIRYYLRGKEASRLTTGIGPLEHARTREIISRDIFEPPRVTVYFHLPDELTSEIVEAGFEHLATLALEGAGWLVPDLEERWQVLQQRQTILRAVRWTEQETTVLGISPHIMGVARKPAPVQ